jgi:FkbM family methyltransferase
MTDGGDQRSTLLARLLGDRGRVRSIAFREGGREFSAEVNEDSLWGSVKDNLLIGEYERSGISLADVRGVVVDAGAHVGLFSLLASAHARAVVSLEAHPANFALLEANIARNEAGHVEARNRALWSELGRVSFVEGDQSGHGSVLGEEGRRFEVETETLDSIVETTGPVDLLKLDIEGAEFDVLDRAADETLQQISAIVAEVHLHRQKSRLTATLERLHESGFHVVVRRPPLAHWWETMGALAEKRGRLRGELRLRLVVAGLYSAMALARPLRSRLEAGDELLFLYAKRSSS